MDYISDTEYKLTYLIKATGETVNIKQNYGGMTHSPRFRVQGILLGAGEANCAAACHQSPVRLAPKQAVAACLRPLALYPKC